MQGGSLRCSAANCSFNQRGDCMAGVINIRGAEAVTTQGTTCSSYVNRSANTFTNSTNYKHTQPENIRCEAYKCTYNENKNCMAENVRIDAYKASCDTFFYEK